MVGDGVGGFFDMLYNIFPDKYALVITLVFFTAVIALYAIFVYYFYRFLGKKNIIELNLNKYNQSENSFFIKFFAFLFYVLEYLIILPVLTLIWFAVFSSFLLLLSKSFDIATVLTISAALIASVRVTSYISQNLSRDLAKMLPFTLLALLLTQPSFFSVSLFLERFSELPSLLSQIPYYLIFIIIVELIMRVIDLLTNLLNIERPAVASV